MSAVYRMAQEFGHFQARCLGASDVDYGANGDYGDDDGRQYMDAPFFIPLKRDDDYALSPRHRHQRWATCRAAHDAQAEFESSPAVYVLRGIVEAMADQAGDTVTISSDAAEYLAAVYEDLVVIVRAAGQLLGSAKNVDAAIDAIRDAREKAGAALDTLRDTL